MNVISKCLNMTNFVVCPMCIVGLPFIWRHKSPFSLKLSNQWLHLFTKLFCFPDLHSWLVGQGVLFINLVRLKHFISIFSPIVFIMLRSCFEMTRGVWCPLHSLVKLEQVVSLFSISWLHHVAIVSPKRWFSTL